MWPFAAAFRRSAPDLCKQAPNGTRAFERKPFGTSAVSRTSAGRFGPSLPSPVSSHRRWCAITSSGSTAFRMKGQGWCGAVRSAARVSGGLAIQGFLGCNGGMRAGGVLVIVALGGCARTVCPSTAPESRIVRPTAVPHGDEKATQAPVLATIQRTGCDGWCPMYLVNVHVDGTVE